MHLNFRKEVKQLEEQLARATADEAAILASLAVFARNMKCTGSRATSNFLSAGSQNRSFFRTE